MNGCEASEMDARKAALSRPLHIETPLLKSRKLSEHLGCSVWLKMETMQNSGSFKVRGIGHLCQKVGVVYMISMCACMLCFVVIGL